MDRHSVGTCWLYRQVVVVPPELPTPAPMGLVSCRHPGCKCAGLRHQLLPRGACRGVCAGCFCAIEAHPACVSLCRARGVYGSNSERALHQKSFAFSSLSFSSRSRPSLPLPPLLSRPFAPLIYISISFYFLFCFLLSFPFLPATFLSHCFPILSYPFLCLLSRSLSSICKDFLVLYRHRGNKCFVWTCIGRIKGI